jgi:hypothetical protein
MTMNGETISDRATGDKLTRLRINRLTRGVDVADLVATALMLVALFLPWFVVKTLTRAGDASPDGSVSFTWLGHNDYAQSLVNIMIPLGTAGCVFASVLGFVRSSWAVWLAACAAYLVGLIGVLLQLSRIDSGLLDPPGFSATTAGLGLWLYAAAAAVGASSSGFGIAMYVTGRAER